MINLWPLLLPAAAWSGWWVATRQYEGRSQHAPNQLSREYVVGLNYLLNEQPDKAVDVFIKLLEVDSDTVETHLALGSLFRRRGEVDRAIRVHQNLIARPQLSVLQRKEALQALGQDYMSAGVFDRAERIFLEVVALGGTHEIESLHGLLAIYQQEKAWEKALEVLRQIETSTGSSMSSQAAHYYCEMALQSIKQNLLDKSYKLIKEALFIDKHSVRASLMWADLEIKNGRYQQAIRYLIQVPKQDAEFLTEIIAPLMQCYHALNKMDDCMTYLEKIAEEYPNSSVIFAIGEHLKQERSLDAAIDFVSSQLSKHSSIRGLNHLIGWHLESAQGKVRERLQMLYEVTTQFLMNKPIYRCGQCGYGGKLLHWHCPSCKQWGKMKPIQGLEGE